MVGYGSNDLVKIYEKKQYVEVEKTLRHPYHSRIRYDLALLKLKSPLNFTDSVQPACLPEKDEDHYEGVLKVR